MNCSKQKHGKNALQYMSSQQDILASSRPTGKEGPYCLRIVDLEGKEVKCFFILEQILQMQELEGSKTHIKHKMQSPDLYQVSGEIEAS